MASPLQRRRLWRRYIFALAAGVSPLVLVRAADKLWIGGSGLWSDPTHWLDGAAPPVAGDATYAVKFLDPQGSTVLSQLDTGPFALNSLTLQSRLSNNLQITTTNGSAFRFSGANAGLINLGNSDAHIGGSTLLSDLLISGSGLGTLTMDAMGELGGAHSVTIATSAIRPDLGQIQYAFTNTYSGGTFLQSGTLRLVSASVGAGGSPMRIYGGYLSINVTTFNKPIELYADLNIIRLPDTVWNGAILGMVSTAGLTVRDGNSLTLTAASTYTGETTIDVSLRSGSAAGNAPTVILSGNGSILSSSAINIRNGGRLTVRADPGGPTDRLSSTAIIHLQGAQLRFEDVSGTAADKSEAVGAIEISGLAKVAFVPGTTGLATFSTPEIRRVDRGTLLVTGISTGAGQGRLTSTIAPVLSGSTSTSGTNLPIVAYALGDTTADLNGSSFVTFTAANVYRLLDPTTEYATTLTAGADRNVRLTASVAATTATMNSLLLAGSGLTISGTPTLTITSGALATLNSNTITPNLDFGTAEGVITTTGGSTLTLNGSITGSNGLTKTGAGTLVLKLASNFSGPLTVAAGVISFSASNQLGTDAGPIVLHGVGSGLTYTGTTPLAFARVFSLKSGSGVIRVTGTGDLTLTGGTTGSGAARFNGSAAGGRIILTDAVQHTGATLFQGGLISFSSDNQLGAGGDLGVTGASTLELTGDWTSARRLDVGAALTLHPNGHNVTLSGPVTGSNPWTKTTAGTVRISGEGTMDGTIDYSSGRLELGGAGAIRSTSVTLSNGGQLIFDNAAQPISNRLAENQLMAIASGELRLEGNSTTFVTETLSTIRHVYNSAAGSFALTLTAPGTAGTVLKLADFESTVSSGIYPSLAPLLVITGDNLGGGPAGAYSRVIPTTAAVGFRKDLVVQSGGVTSFAINDGTIDSAGAIGLRPLLAAEYSSATLIANSGNGGATPTTAHLLLSGNGVAAGVANTAQDLTLQPGSKLTLAGGQTLTLSNGGVVTSGGASARIDGGILDLGSAPMGVHLAGDLSVTSQITTSAAAILKSGPGTLHLESGAQMATPLFVTSGAVSVTDATVLANTPVYIAPAGTLEAAAATTFASVRGDGLVTKTGAGTVTITDASQFTGPLQVAAGAAKLSGVVGISSTNSITVEAGAQLLGAATLNHPLTVRGSLAPGDGIGTIASRDLTFADGSEFRLEIGSAGRDQASVTGAVTFQGLTQLRIDTLDAYQLGSGWAVLLNDGADPIVTSSTRGLALGSTVLTEGTIFTVGSQGFRITYMGGDGNDIYLTIPEPSFAGLLSVGALGLLRRRRRVR